MPTKALIGFLLALALAFTAPAQPAAQPTRGELRFGSPEPTPRPQGVLRLATYNLENLFADRGQGRQGATPAKPAAERAAVAEALRRIDADVVALQEVESLETLIAFRDEYLSGLGYEHVASLDAGDSRGIEQSVLSRFPLSGAKVWGEVKLEGVHIVEDRRDRIAIGDPIVLRRSPLRVTVTVPAEAAQHADDYEVTLLVVHQKSGRQFDYWRQAESAAFAKWALDEMKDNPDRRVVILGDFNAQPHEPSVLTYLNAGFTDAFAHRISGDPRFITHESGRAIDLILLNAPAARDLIPETRFILGAIARPAGVDWRTYAPPPGYASDHYPVVIDLRLAEPGPKNGP